MRLLRLALFSEGPSDQRMLSPILRALCRELCWARGSGVELPEEVLELRAATPKREGLAPRFREAVLRAESLFDLAFIHCDADQLDPERARQERLDPCIAAIEDTSELRRRLVASRCG